MENDDPPTMGGALGAHNADRVYDMTDTQKKRLISMYPLLTKNKPPQSRSFAYEKYGDSYKLVDSDILVLLAVAKDALNPGPMVKRSRKTGARRREKFEGIAFSDKIALKGPRPPPKIKRGPPQPPPKVLRENANIFERPTPATVKRMTDHQRSMLIKRWPLWRPRKPPVDSLFAYDKATKADGIRGGWLLADPTISRSIEQAMAMGSQYEGPYPKFYDAEQPSNQESLNAGLGSGRSKAKLISPKLPTPSKQGSLSRYGYRGIKTMHSKDRRQALIKAMYDLDRLAILRRLNLLANLNKNKDPALAEVLREDVAWIQRYRKGKRMKPLPSTEGRRSTSVGLTKISPPRTAPKAPGRKKSRWNVFVTSYKGSGYTKAQLSEMYKRGDKPKPPHKPGRAPPKAPAKAKGRPRKEKPPPERQFVQFRTPKLYEGPTYRPETIREWQRLVKAVPKAPTPASRPRPPKGRRNSWEHYQRMVGESRQWTSARERLLSYRRWVAGNTTPEEDLELQRLEHIIHPRITNLVKPKPPPAKPKAPQGKRGVAKDGKMNLKEFSEHTKDRGWTGRRKMLEYKAYRGTITPLEEFMLANIDSGKTPAQLKKIYEERVKQ